MGHRQRRAALDFVARDQAILGRLHRAPQGRADRPRQPLFTLAPVADDLVISLYLTNRSVGLFVRGQRGESHATTASRLSAYEPRLGQALGAGLRDFPGCCYLGRLPLAVTDPACWPRGHEWLEREEQRYCRVLEELVL